MSKILTDEAFEVYEKSEELVAFVKEEHPYLTDEESTVLAKTIAAKRIEDLQIDLMKEKKKKKKKEAKNG